MHGWPNSLEILKELGETTPLITHPILQTILQWQRPVWPCLCSTSSTTRPPRTTAPPVQGAGETRPGECHVLSRMSWMIRPKNSLQMIILHPDFISISHGNRSPCFFLWFLSSDYFLSRPIFEFDISGISPNEPPWMCILSPPQVVVMLDSMMRCSWLPYINNNSNNSSSSMSSWPDLRHQESCSPPSSWMRTGGSVTSKPGKNISKISKNIFRISKNIFSI